MLEWLALDFRFLLQDFLTYAILLAALAWGAGPERAMILVWVFFFEFLKIPYTAIRGDVFQLQSTDFFLASLDLLAGSAWIMIALCANRNYPLFVAGLQLLAMAAHLARGLIEAILPVAYIVMVVAPGWIQLVIMAVGLWRHTRRERQYGPYRDWRHSSPWFTWLSYRWKRV